MRTNRALSGLGPTFMVAGVLLLAGRDAAAQNSCVTAQCHATLLTPKHVHPPSEACDTCHESVATPHPKTGTKTFKLTQEPPALCEACHDAYGKKSDVHPPVKEGMCTTCHDPHASNEPKLLTQPMKDLCTACHDHKASFAHEHAPVAAGECTACHAAHESDIKPLLTASFPSGPYAPYTDTEYALCFTCHERELIQLPDTSSATGFRDGERNLHYLHVNDKQKGRSCTMCHELHGSNQPKLIADSVPFGKWKLPLKFVKTDTGGSCAPGCHKIQNYDRKTPGKPAGKAS